MADICKELRKQLHELDVLRESCVSLLVRKGMESAATKETIGEFDTLTEELHDAVVLYRQPFNERLDDIERKMKKKENLTKWEYWVLYGIDLHLKGGNHEERERRKDMVKRWRSDEEKKQDLALALDIIPDRISVTEKEALSGNIQYHYGGLCPPGHLHPPRGIASTSGDELILPEEISGGLTLSALISVHKLTLPKEIGGFLMLDNLTSAGAGLTMPEKVGGSLHLDNLKSIKIKLTMPKKVGDNLNISGLRSINTKITFPEEVEGIIYVNKALPENEKEELERRYPGKIREV